MITGVVNARHEAIVRLKVRGPGHPGLDVNAVIDTGFTEALTLSAATIAMLGLTQHSTGPAMLADGSLQQFDTYTAEVDWDGGWQLVLVYASSEALLGMLLLASHELRISVVPGGALEITPIP